MISSFEFLKNINELYCEIAEQAEKLLFSDPKTSIHKLSTLCELLVKNACQKQNIDISRHTFSDLIRELAKCESIDNTIYTKLNNILIAGNNKRYSYNGSLEVAKRIVADTYDVCCWYVDGYCDYTRHRLPYYLPEETYGQQQKYERLDISREATSSLLDNLRSSSQEIPPQQRVEGCETSIDAEEIRIAKPDDKAVRLSDDQFAAFERMEEENGNLFITGEAGTGKSAVLKYFRENSRKCFAIVAPTGIAALNVGGQTIHSFFGMNASAQDVSDYSQSAAGDKVRARLKKIDTLIIDEISMVRVDVMDMIDNKLRRARGKMGVPFGGCQIIAFGDLFQLPPVQADEEERKFLRDRYDSEFFFSAPGAVEAPFRVVELTTNHRQGDAQKEFLEILRAIRTTVDAPKNIRKLNEKCIRPCSDDVLTLTASRKGAQEINDAHLERLPGKEYCYHAVVKGEFEKESEEGSRLPTERNLRLKVGAKIMMVKNDVPRHRWVNGSFGEVTDLTDEYIEVQFESGAKHHVYQETWESYKTEYDEEAQELIQETVGSFYQFPLKLAYAITIHKSQGLTYERMKLDLTHKEVFEAGQIYVALSRCKSIEGLYLEQPISEDCLIISPKIIEYLSGTYQPEKMRPEIERLVEWIDGGRRLKLTPPKNPKKITARRFPAVLNRHPYDSPFKVWCEITKLYEEPFEGNKYTEAGKVIEPKQYKYLLQIMGENQKYEIETPQDAFGNQEIYDAYPDNPIFGGKWDYLLKNDGQVFAAIEMKTTGEKNRWKWNPYAPVEYLLQAALYAYLTGVDKYCMVSSFLNEADYNQPERYECDKTNTMIGWYKVPADMSERIEKATDWWEQHITGGISPIIDDQKDGRIINAMIEEGIIPPRP